MRHISTMLWFTGLVLMLECIAVPLNGQTNSIHYEAFRIPHAVSVNSIAVRNIEDDPLHSTKFPMRVKCSDEILTVTDRQSISKYMELTKAIKVMGETQVDTDEKAKLLSREPRWLICVDGIYTNILPEQRKQLSDGNISFEKNFRIYGNQLCEHHPQHPVLYLTEGDGVSNLVQFIEKELGKHEQSESHNKVSEGVGSNALNLQY